MFSNLCKRLSGVKWGACSREQCLGLTRSKNLNLWGKVKTSQVIPHFETAVKESETEETALQRKHRHATWQITDTSWWHHHSGTESGKKLIQLIYYYTISGVVQCTQNLQKYQKQGKPSGKSRYLLRPNQYDYKIYYLYQGL